MTGRVWEDLGSPSSSEAVEDVSGSIKNVGSEEKKVQELEGSGDEKTKGFLDQGVGEEKGSGFGVDGRVEVGKGSGAFLRPVIPERREWRNGSQVYPLRLGAEDCRNYMSTGCCSYGRMCRFNHPFLRQGTGSEVISWDSLDQKQSFLRSEGNEELPQRVGQKECKFYLTRGGCRYGDACKYRHYQEKIELEPAKLNIFGFPLRPGERDCPYYMNEGCRFSYKCKYNHPNPISKNKEDSLSRYQHDESQINASIPSQGPMAHLPGRPSNGTDSYSEFAQCNLTGMLLQIQQLQLKPECEDSQDSTSPVFQGTKTQRQSTKTFDGTAAKGDEPTKQQPQMEYPERPGEPDCPPLVMKGDSEFSSKCTFQQSGSFLSNRFQCKLNPVGLPLRPGQRVCPFYGRFGICKFGPACEFDHPMKRDSSASPAANSQCPISTPAGMTGEVKMESSNSKGKLPE